MEVRAGLVPATQDQTANPVIGGTQDFANSLVNFPVSKVQTRQFGADPFSAFGRRAICVQPNCTLLFCNVRVQICCKIIFFLKKISITHHP